MHSMNYDQAANSNFPSICQQTFVPSSHYELSTLEDLQMILPIVISK